MKFLFREHFLYPRSAVLDRYIPPTLVSSPERTSGPGLLPVPGLPRPGQGPAFYPPPFMIQKADNPIAACLAVPNFQTRNLLFWDLVRPGFAVPDFGGGPPALGLLNRYTPLIAFTAARHRLLYMPPCIQPLPELALRSQGETRPLFGRSSFGGFHDKEKPLFLLSHGRSPPPSMPVSSSFNRVDKCAISSISRIFFTLVSRNPARRQRRASTSLFYFLKSRLFLSSVPGCRRAEIPFLYR